MRGGGLIRRRGREVRGTFMENAPERLLPDGDVLREVSPYPLCHLPTLRALKFGSTMHDVFAAALHQTRLPASEIWGIFEVLPRKKISTASRHQKSVWKTLGTEVFHTSTYDLCRVQGV